MVGFDGRYGEGIAARTLGSIALDRTNGRFKAYWACGIEGGSRSLIPIRAAAKLVVCDWLRTRGAQIRDVVAARRSAGRMIAQ